MRVALVTTWDQACGIAEHSYYLNEAIVQADPGITIEVVTNLHPLGVLALPKDPDVLILNYHAALHSQWTPDAIREIQRREVSVLVIYHDSGVPNSDQCRQIAYVLRPRLDAMIVHEPFEDLPIEKVRYWRMGIPSWAGALHLQQGYKSWTEDRPVLGSIGFPFPWKNYDELAKVTQANGWALLLIAPGATAADRRRWEALNPCCYIGTAFLPRETALAHLAACDATAFCYTCANTGQSGAVCLGIAARKPVIALDTCRQFRALLQDPLGAAAISWATDFYRVETFLRSLPIQRCDPGIVALAEQDSWRRLGQKYAALIRELVR